MAGLPPDLSNAYAAATMYRQICQAQAAGSRVRTANKPAAPEPEAPDRAVP